MFRRKRSKSSLLSPTARDAPPVPTAVDVEIANHQGSTVAIEATQERMQAAKKMPTPNLSQMIEQRTCENGRLRHELAFMYQKNEAAMCLYQDMVRVKDSIEKAMRSFYDF